MNTDDIEFGSAEHALAVADRLERAEKGTLGPSDIELCVKALRALPSLMDSGLVYFGAHPDAVYRVRAWTNEPSQELWLFHVEITLRTGDTIYCDSADLCSKIWSGGGGSARERFQAAIRAVIADVNFRPPALSGA